jgi:hypothetical protein
MPAMKGEIARAITITGAIFIILTSSFFSDTSPEVPNYMPDARAAGLESAYYYKLLATERPAHGGSSSDLMPMGGMIIKLFGGDQLTLQV